MYQDKKMSLKINLQGHLSFFDSDLLHYSVPKDLFGDVIHAEGEYVHDLRGTKFAPDGEPWRLQHSVNRNGNLYPDHPMASITCPFDINHGDRFDFLVSVSSSAKALSDVWIQSNLDRITSQIKRQFGTGLGDLINGVKS
ncbi:hypothetical protein ACFL4Z_01260 [candidate division KSB1 bacterium]